MRIWENQICTVDGNKTLEGFFEYYLDQNINNKFMI